MFIEDKNNLHQKIKSIMHKTSVANCLNNSHIYLMAARNQPLNDIVLYGFPQIFQGCPHMI